LGGPSDPTAGAPQPSPPKRRRRGLRLFLGFAATGFLLAVVAAVGAYLWAIDLYQRPGPLQAEATVMVARGSGLNAIASSLESEGVIERADIFTLAAKIEGKAGSLKAGEYLFPAGISMQDALDLLVEGRVVLHRVTVPEGLTSWEVVQMVNAAPDLEGPAIEAVPEEGSLLPDTYFFERGETRQQLLARMEEAQDEVLAELWPTRDPDLPFDSQEAWVTLASIVEKETGLPEERSLVAGVFVNRLKRGMLLQSDPTVIYAVTKGVGGPLGRGLRRSELAKEDPYNTYSVAGLPPGPIANPGRDALEATIRPQATDYLYFVADGTGGHAFSETLNEHQRKVREWRKIERERREQAGE